MGQFFTPRKVIWNIVEMAKVENLQNGARVCDPFCWVWWFPLEVIAKRNNKDFVVKNNKIIEKIEYFGFDKWSSEKDSERTIILAKANMLIYLADLIKENSWLTKEFSDIFNKTFKLKKWTLWTLADISDKEENKFDLIITNPPYVTSWSSILKEEIAKDQDKLDFYKINWMWVEWLAIEWIIRKLKKWWKAFVVVPDWIFNRLNDNRLRKFIMEECFINWIISLPINTFFTTPKKTYILVITKKDKKEDVQINPIFTYLVTDIWETLDTYRFDTWKSDLETAKNLFKMFDWNETYFTTDDKRCKIQKFSKFEEEVNNNWTVDRWWSKEEKIELWIEEQEELLNLNEFLDKFQDIKWKIIEMEKEILHLTKWVNDIKKGALKEMKILDVFDFFPSWKLRKINDLKGDIPVLSWQKMNDGIIWYCHKALIEDASNINPYITFGDHTRYINIRTFPFNTTDAVRILKIKQEFKGLININYIIEKWKSQIPNLGYARHWKVARNIVVNIPTKENWEFDLEKQREIANKYEKIDKIKNNLTQELEDLEKIKIEIS
jgi:type I restriction-modification system DNA methylase subunit